MEQKMIDYVRATYNPVAIILHGSRASGHARAHSDWDFICLYEATADLSEDGRAEVLGENVEFSQHQLPIADALEEFSVQLQNARVVYEQSNEGTDVLRRAQIEYIKPLGWNERKKYNHSLWMRSRIEAMKDTLDTQLLFEKYAADFYQRITNYWYWAIHDTYPKPIYLAVEEIAAADPEYFFLIEQYANADNKQKIEIAEQIFTRCFL